ncbi:MAG: hypothetical protein KIT09_08925 [Bryobacteraceae bacterium]|nr:hypothetical protein [Bryobacteraceae bacterium]
MTGKQRLLAAFHGELPDMVPFAPNICYWFYNRLARGTLPEEIAGAEHPFDVLRVLGADILARWDTQYATREVYRSGEFHDEFAGESRFDRTMTTAFNIYPPRRNVRRRRFATPYGTLTHSWRLTEESGADFEEEFWWKNWGQYDAVRFLLEARDYAFDRAEFERWADRAGDDGIVMASVTQSPLKTFHWLAGAENASLFIADYPEEMKALARIHEKKALALLETMVDTPSVDVFVSLDNLDSAFYSPSLYRDFCDSFYARAAEIIHSRGKIFVVHACGYNRLLLPLVGRSRVDCLEGITPPPMGNVELGEARRLAGYDNFTVNGGMDASRMETGEGAEAALHAYTRALFESMGDKRRFIYASSCATSAATPWDNLKYCREAAWRYGRVG